jgi:dihydroorotate dehydrogenase (fumarate)
LNRLSFEYDSFEMPHSVPGAPANLITNYLGLALKNPLVASASPPNANLDHVRRLEEAGAGAIVLPSLFEEQIAAEAAIQAERIDLHSYNSPEASSYLPATVTDPYGVGPSGYLDLIRRASAAATIPIIASLNGVTHAGWIDYAALLEQAGAAAIELNMYHIPVDLTESGATIEARYVGIVAAVCGKVNIPVSVKLTPYLSSLGHIAQALAHRGAKGLVLFNRLLEPDIDLVNLRLTERLELSTPGDLRLPLLWTAILAGRTPASLALSGGVSSVDDVVKAILAGADVVMMTSAVLREGPTVITRLMEGLKIWMERRNFSDLAAIRGMMSWARSPDAGLYTRANYLMLLEHYATDHR